MFDSEKEVSRYDGFMDVDFYKIAGGVIYPVFYFYDCGDGRKDHYRKVEFACPGIMVGSTDVRNRLEGLEAEGEQWITNLDAKGVVKELRRYNRDVKPLSYENITSRTPDGFYVDQRALTVSRSIGAVSCPQCGDSRQITIGGFGNRMVYRCPQCGWQYTIPEDAEEDEDDLYDKYNRFLGCDFYIVSDGRLKPVCQFGYWASEMGNWRMLGYETDWLPIGRSVRKDVETAEDPVYAGMYTYLTDDQFEELMEQYLRNSKPLIYEDVKKSTPQGMYCDIESD